MRMWHILQPFFLLTLAFRVLPQGTTEESTISSTERVVLLQLYESTNGDRWKDHSGWKGPAGTECNWFGVICEYGPEGQPRVEGLFLEENGLNGTLPSKLDSLSELSELLVFGNQLSGPVPPLTLKRFDEGRLRFLGYAGQFSPIIEVDLTSTPSGVICGAYEIVLRMGGPDTLGREYCRNASDDDRATFWERSTGRIGVYSGDIDRVARFIETTGVEKLAAGYSRNITHGTFETITIVYRDGHRKTIEDYAEAAPAPIWLLKRILEGAAFNGQWEQTIRSIPVIQ